MSKKERPRRQTHGLSIIETIIVIAIIAVSIPTLFSIFFSVIQVRMKAQALQSLKQKTDISLNVIKNLIRQRAIGIYSGLDSNGNLDPTKKECTAASPTFSVTNPGLVTPGIGTNPILYFKDATNPSQPIYMQLFPFINANQLAYFADGQQNDLNDEFVGIEQFEMSCTWINGFTPPIVTIKIVANIKLGSGVRQEEKDRLSFYTVVKMRNYEQ